MCYDALFPDVASLFLIRSCSIQLSMPSHDICGCASIIDENHIHVIPYPAQVWCVCLRVWAKSVRVVCVYNCMPHLTYLSRVTDWIGWLSCVLSSSWGSSPWGFSCWGCLSCLSIYLSVYLSGLFGYFCSAPVPVWSRQVTSFFLSFISFLGPSLVTFFTLSHSVTQSLSHSLIFSTSYLPFLIACYLVPRGSGPSFTSYLPRTCPLLYQCFGLIKVDWGWLND